MTLMDAPYVNISNIAPRSGANMQLFGVYHTKFQ